MPLIRTSSQYSFKPIPENDIAQNYHNHHHHHGNNQQQQPTNDTIVSNNTATNNNSTVNRDHQALPQPLGKPPVCPVNPSSTPNLTSSAQDASVEELRRLVSDLQNGGVGDEGGGGGWSGTGEGSRPSSRCSVRSSSRHGSRYGSRRSSWVLSDDEEEEERAEVTGNQKAQLLVVSQQRLVYTLQGLRHELTSLDEEVNRIRNDVLNSRRFFNAMRGIPEQPYWGSAGRRAGLGGSATNSPRTYNNSLDNSYSDDMHSIARSESCSSFASWRSESELCGVFREAEDTATSDQGSNKDHTPCNDGSDTSNSNDFSSSGSSNTNSFGGKDTGVNGPASFSRMRGRYRQLGTPNHRA